MADESDTDVVEPLTDDELTALALAADPDTPVDDDAVSLWPLTESGTDGLLPEWYMPSPARGLPRLQGWRRWVTLLIIASFLTDRGLWACAAPTAASLVRSG